MATSRAPSSPHPVLGDDALELVAARFRVLGDRNRLRILNALMSGERSVGELVAGTGLEQPSVSRHLAALRREGIVARRSERNRAFYRIDDETVVKLCAVVCEGLAERLADELESLPNAEAWRGAGI